MEGGLGGFSNRTNTSLVPIGMHTDECFRCEEEIQIIAFSRAAAACLLVVCRLAVAAWAAISRQRAGETAAQTAIAVIPHQRHSAEKIKAKLTNYKDNSKGTKGKVNSHTRFGTKATSCAD